MNNSTSPSNQAHSGPDLVQSSVDQSSQQSPGQVRLPPPHRLLPDPQFHQQGFLPPMQIHRQLPPLHSLYPPPPPPPSAQPGQQYHHHPQPGHDLLQQATMLNGPTSNPQLDSASPRRTRSASAVSGLSLSASPASSTASSLDSVVPLSMVSSTSSMDLNSTAKRRPARNRTSSTGSTGSVASSASLSSSSAPDYDSLGRKKPRIPRNPSSWDPHDDLLLRHLKEQQKLGWKDIANHFMGRTPNACQFRWRRLMSGSLRGGTAPAREGSWVEDGEWAESSQSSQQVAHQPLQVIPQYLAMVVPPVPNHMQIIPPTTTRPLLAPPSFDDAVHGQQQVAATMPTTAPAAVEPVVQEQQPSVLQTQHNEKEQLPMQEVEAGVSPKSLPQSASSARMSPVESEVEKDVDRAEGRSESVESSSTVTPASATSTQGKASSVSSAKSASGKIWSQEEDDLVTRRDLRFEELSVLLPSRTETEIWNRIESLQTAGVVSR
ncbi:hypothetical protein V1512DRAFT_258340 [Lipomyces arxii]|uniref:uncharacterized protein n=1 Tax=Lipomyces arxii TaxID=56418 RepID=UPI0034CDDA06